MIQPAPPDEPEPPDEAGAMLAEPVVELVDADGNAHGAAGKLAAHQPPGHRHRAISVLLLDLRGRLLVQQRAAGKYHWAGCWSNACCGHPAPEQPPVDAARGRVAHELGVTVTDLTAAGTVSYRFSDPDSGLVEHEYNHLFVGRTGERLLPAPEEVAAVAAIPLDAVEAWLPTVRATAWFRLVLRAAWPALDTLRPGSQPAARAEHGHR